MMRLAVSEQESDTRRRNIDALNFLGHIDQVISVPPRSPSFVDLLGPPMEQRGRPDALGLPLEGGTPSKLRVFEVLDGGEMLVDQRGIGERLRVQEMLGGL